MKLTLTPQLVTEQDVQAMRDAGLSERGILDANLVVCLFAFENRLADGLGIELDRDIDGKILLAAPVLRLGEDEYTVCHNVQKLPREKLRS